MAKYAVNGTFQAFIEAENEEEVYAKLYNQCGELNINVEDIEEYDKE